MKFREINLEAFMAKKFSEFSLDMQPCQVFEAQ